MEWKFDSGSGLSGTMESHLNPSSKVPRMSLEETLNSPVMRVIFFPELRITGSNPIAFRASLDRLSNLIALSVERQVLSRITLLQEVDS